MESMQDRFRKAIPLKFMDKHFDPQTQITHQSKRLKFGHVKSI